MKRYIAFILTALLLNIVNAQENTDSIPQGYVMDPTLGYIIDTTLLQEVVITASRPVTRLKSNGIETRIAGTMLDKLGSADDVLGFMPGVISDNGSIEVIGRGIPAIYINGRLVRNNTELEQLSSEVIENITVINNPGARYGSNVNSVILITTKKEFGEGFAFNTKTNVGYMDYLYGKEVVGMNYRNGKFDVYSTLQYSNFRSKISSMNETNIWNDNSQTLLEIASNKTLSQIFDGRIGFNYTADSIHAFGAFYKARFTPQTTDIDGSYEWFINDNNELSKFYSQRNKYDYYEHLINAYYSGNYNKLKIDFNIDYMFRDNEESQSINEKDNLGTNSITIKDKSLGNLLATELNASYPLGKSTISFGSEYTNSSRQQNLSNVESVVENSDTHIEEDNAAVYAEITRAFRQLSLTLGLRYEYTHNKYYEFGEILDDKSREYNELLPTLSLTFPIKKTMWQLGYSRNLIRPLYSQLSSSISYTNKYLYERGNPLLKTSYRDNISMVMKYKWLMLTADYKRTKDRIITSSTIYNDSIILIGKDNSLNDIHSYELMAIISPPNLIAGFYYPAFVGGVTGQFYDIEHRGETMSMNRPMVLIKSNNIFFFPRKYKVAIDFQYRSLCEIDNTSINHNTWQINFNLTKTFNEHWELVFTVNDLFNTAKFQSYTIYSEMIDFATERTNNTRYVQLSVEYKFNMPKSRYKGVGAGQSEKERLVER
ncbi:MAG: TonB-dependent receptor [Bacteroidales bacterium]|nr:TonB-dependent receptor [Lentimicrobiaceae bacterium]MBQ3594678.1 TonB-dependent receptor [Bacteroidales bacterium]